MPELIHDSQREKDVQNLCNAILYIGITSTGDYGSGGECPFCLTDCRWDASMDEFTHKPDCAYLIAKDISTNQ
jgi:hypothetical protein